MPPIAVIWDMDGTLVDTAELHFDAWVKLAAELGKPFSREDFAATFGRRNPEIIDYLFHDVHSPAEIAELGERKERYYRAEAARGVALLPGARQLLTAIAERGIPQAIGSSAPRDNLELILDLTESRPYFQGIVSMEDTSRGKPDPEVFLVAAKKLKAEPNRCIVFEDAVAGVQAAKAGGMKCVAVRFVGHHSDQALRAAGADRIVESLENVLVDELLKLTL